MAKNKNSHAHDAAQAEHDAHRPNVKVYIAVFAALLFLTGLTVLVSKFHLPRPQAITLGLLIAAVKGGLVAGIFMHLWGEKKLIHTFLKVTAFCACILVIPIIDFVLLAPKIINHADIAAQHPDESVKESAPAAETPAEAPAPVPTPAPAKTRKTSKGKKK